MELHDVDWERLRAGEAYRRAAFEALARQYSREVRACCVQWFGEALGEDIAQEVFKKAWQLFPPQHPTIELKSWLSTMTRDLCRKVAQKTKRRSMLEVMFKRDLHENTQRSDPSNPEDQLTKQDSIAEIIRALESIAEEDRRLLLWRLVVRRPVKEIAYVYGENDNTISVRIKRAIARMQKEVGHDPER